MYKLKNPSNLDDGKFLETVLKNRGIENIYEFLVPNESSLIHYSKLDNIHRAVEKFSNIVQRESAHIGILVDSDP